MSQSIIIPDEGLTIACADGQTVLEAVEQAGYAIPYSCRKGVCSSCEGTIVSGAAMVRGQGLITGPADRVLLCQTRPRGDVTIAPARIRRAGVIDRKRIDCRVRKIDRPAADVAVIRLRLPIGLRAPFCAGQYLRVMMADGDSRNYSMANPPHRNDEIELHIRHVAGGKFSESVLATLDRGSTLTIELPYGEFTLGENRESQAILLATGTGFAPIKSIVEDQIQRGLRRPIHLYWGANRESDLYMRDLAERWAMAHDWFSFTPVVSAPSADWRGRMGLVHLAVLQDYPDMTGLEVYACGAPAMIEAARLDFNAQGGLGLDAFFSDAFVPSGDAEGGETQPPAHSLNDPATPATMDVT